MTNLQTNGLSARALARRQDRQRELEIDFFRKVRRSVDSERRPGVLAEKVHTHTRRTLVQLFENAGANKGEVTAMQELMQHLQPTQKGSRINEHALQRTAIKLRHSGLTHVIEALKRHAEELRTVTQEKVTGAGIMSLRRLSQRDLERAAHFTNPLADYAQLAHDAMKHLKKTHHSHDSGVVANV